MFSSCAGTAAGRLVLVSFEQEQCVVLQDRQEAVTVIQTHPERSVLLLGRANGSLSLIDYAKKEVMVTFTLDCKLGADPVPITSLCYSPNGTVLACGRANGSLYVLHPVLLHPVTAHPFHKTRTAVHHLCFSPDNMFMAHSDGANFVSAYRWLSEHRWVYLGKKQLHTKPVRGLLFGPQPCAAPLFSFGEDHILVEYDVANSLNSTLLVTRFDNIEPSGLPLSVTWCPVNGDEPVLLIATSEFKYRLVDLTTRSVCGTAQGPRLHTTVSAIQTIGGAAARAPATAVYATQRRLGLQCLPPDGNPFKNVAMIVHPVKLMAFVISPCEEFVFTCGSQDHGVLMWRVNRAAAEALLEGAGAGGRRSGPELEPWLLSVEGGREGWLVQAMRDMFCYAQMLHQGTLSTEPRLITDSLPVCELPDVMRALGFFPSQSQINTMVSEVLNRCGENLSSSDLVKLYVNHKPVFGTALAKLREAFDAFAYPIEGTDETAMTREKFLSILLDRGEALDLDEAQSVLRELLQVETDTEAEGQYSYLLMDEASRREKLFYYLPETITFSYFVDTLLGIVKK
ncbi:Cilia- and flagella-associated protein 251 [Frankliniella fusca]|uniref:Cilia- and flagella-associated protein 251 n=1 Tax=Frankliniella fusca TaxID=407009 RepID=A0AAE1H0N2_9NEOP|nr:Cilia- and flagella-associated protein 251 [Frankliniella fusca]